MADYPSDARVLATYPGLHVTGGPGGFYELKVLLEEVVERAPVRVVEAFFLVLRARDALRICRCSARPCVDHEESKKWRRLRNFNPPSLTSHH